MSGLRAVFGLKNQGHIPTIEGIIKRHQDAYDELEAEEISLGKDPKDYIHIDASLQRHVWIEIGEKIGWEPLSAALDYFEYLKNNKND